MRSNPKSVIGRQERRALCLARYTQIVGMLVTEQLLTIEELKNNPEGTLVMERPLFIWGRLQTRTPHFYMKGAWEQWHIGNFRPTPKNADIWYSQSPLERERRMSDEENATGNMLRLRVE